MFRTKGETFFFRLRKEGNLFFAEAVMLGVKESCEKFVLEVSIFDPESKISSSATLVPRPATATNMTVKDVSLFIRKLWPQFGSTMSR